jgi:hypothetical protein
VRLYQCYVSFQFVFLLTSSYDFSLTFASLYLIFAYINGIAHLWYHTKVTDRKKHFGYVRYTICSILNYIRIFDIEGHKKHHRHTLKTQDQIEHWMDLNLNEYLDNFLNDFFDRLFHFFIKSGINPEYITGIIDIFINISSIIIIFLSCLIYII